MIFAVDVLIRALTQRQSFGRLGDAGGDWLVGVWSGRERAKVGALGEAGDRLVVK